jgi:hypothetical protein
MNKLSSYRLEEIVHFFYQKYIFQYSLLKFIIWKNIEVNLFYLTQFTCYIGGK